MSLLDKLIGPIYVCENCGRKSQRSHKQGWHSVILSDKKSHRFCQHCYMTGAHRKMDGPAVLESEKNGVKVYRGANPPAHWPVEMQMKFKK